MNAPNLSTVKVSPAHGMPTPEMLLEYTECLGPFLNDPDVDEIAINRPGELWTEGRSGWKRYDMPDLSFTDLKKIATLVTNHNKKGKICEAHPIMSASMYGGERVQIVMPPACEPGTISITIRKSNNVDKSLDQLDAEGSFDQYAENSLELQPFEIELQKLKSERKIKEFLDLAVRKHRNIMIVGPTGSGKTTISKSLIRSIPTWERLITIEDVHELYLNMHPNKVHLFYGREDEGGSTVTAKSALASCLRMKPDRILLAELRGDESWEFIKSINTGHPGSISTMHANGALESFDQLTALIKDSKTGGNLDAAYVRQRLFATIDVVLFFQDRKLREIYYDAERKRK